MSALLLRKRLPLIVPAIFVVAVAAVGAARLGGYRPADAMAPTTMTRELRFADQDDGSIRVIDAATGAAVGDIAKGGDNFIRATMRGLANARKQDGSGADVPFLLAAHSDGAVTLQDPVTGRTLDLAAFGPTNEAAFVRFLPKAAVAATRLDAKAASL